MSTPPKTTPDVSVAGMQPGDATVEVQPKQGGGLTLSPLPVGGRRRKSKKTAKKTAGRRRRGGADDEVAPVEGARRRKTRKGKKAGRR
jgi:hypothetical protein